MDAERPGDYGSIVFVAQEIDGIQDIGSGDITTLKIHNVGY